MSFARHKIGSANSGANRSAVNVLIARRLDSAQGAIDAAQMIFDSALNPGRAGVRGSTAVRQMLFKSGSLLIDMQIQPTPGSDSRVLIGQLHDSTKPDHGIGGVPVSLLLEGGKVSHDQTNEAGEFDFGIDALGKLQLVFGIGGSRTLVVAVPDGDSLGYS
jgi:hypothetical protein